MVREWASGRQEATFINVVAYLHIFTGLPFLHLPISFFVPFHLWREGLNRQEATSRSQAFRSRFSLSFSLLYYTHLPFPSLFTEPVSLWLRDVKKISYSYTANFHFYACICIFYAFLLFLLTNSSLARLSKKETTGILEAVFLVGQIFFLIHVYNFNVFLPSFLYPHPFAFLFIYFPFNSEA